MTHTVTNMRNNQLDMGTFFDRILNFHRSILNMLIKPGQVLSDDFSYSLTKSVCFFLLKLFGRFYFRLNQVERIIRSIIINGVDAFVLEVVNNGFGRNLDRYPA